MQMPLTLLLLKMLFEIFSVSMRDVMAIFDILIEIVFTLFLLVQWLFHNIDDTIRGHVMSSFFFLVTSLTSSEF